LFHKADRSRINKTGQLDLLTTAYGFAAPGRVSNAKFSLSGGQVLKTYKVALGDPVGAKKQQGDRETPEGEYVIDSKNTHSRFHRALHVSYPNSADRERARKLGVSPGRDVEIHGLPSKYAWLGFLHRQMDWTAGCIAVTNSEIDEIWPLVPLGTPVEIRP